MRNSVDAVIFMLANARGQDKFDDTISSFMSKLDEIAVAPNAEDALREIAASMGIDRAGFDRAVADQAYLDKLNAATTGANKKFGVAGTPSVFVNGQQVRIEMSFNEVAKAVIKATASLE